MNLGLRGRMTLLVTLMVFLLAALAYACLVLVIPRLLDAAVDDGLRQRSADFVADVGAGEAGVDPLTQVLGADGQVVQGPLEIPLLTAAQVASVPPEGLRTEVDLATLGGEIRVLAVPLTVDGPDGQGTVVAVVGSRLAVLEALTVRVADVLAVTSAVVVLLSSVGAWYLVGAVLRPVSAMTAAAARIGARPGPDRLPLPGTVDEVGRLAQTFNDLLARVEAGVARERAFVDDASHELRTPLTVLRGELELAADEPDPALARQGMIHALGAVERLSRTAEDLLVLARLDDGSAHRPELLTLADLAVHLREAAAGTGGLTVRVVADGDDGARGQVSRTEPPVTRGVVTVLADPVALARAVSNLLRNAAMAGATRADVSVTVAGAAAAGNAVGEQGLLLEVADDGPGFPTEFLPHAFERFAQPARSRGGSGSGLGLAIVQAVARSHGGTAIADNDSPLGGGRVQVRLPVRSSPTP
ncbi:ATP-binding protein [Jannaschia sp. R86511]|uniref:ATP-binding protein n=1 Tax=Jannaschia sp. R86511 TaxID=3093853 RepID=UPI0036D3B71B